MQLRQIILNVPIVVSNANAESSCVWHNIIVTNFHVDTTYSLKFAVTDRRMD